jgi:hypothetical protein
LVTSAQAAAPATAQGTIRAKIFNNVSGTSVASLTASDKFPNSPDLVRYEPYFELWAGGDINTAAPSTADNYGDQIVGYFYPPTTGNYTFYLSADDNAALYLSTDDNPANKKLIAQETVWSNQREYTTSGGASDLTAKDSSQFASTEWPTKDTGSGGAKITLTAGKAYYIEALHKEGTGGDNLSVSTDGSLPIAGSNLSPYGAPAGPAILVQPVDVGVVVGGLSKFSVGLDIPPGGTTTIKWTKNGTDIANSNTNSLTLPAAVAGDNAAKIKAVITSGGATVTSSEATLYVATVSNTYAVGVVKFEAYNDINGTAVSDLTSNSKYTSGTPDDVKVLSAIDSPNGYGDNYGAKVSGFITPPTSGSYRFFIRSDDASELWLSTNDKESSAVKIAEETDCCDAFVEPDVANDDGATFATSQPINLVAGTKYAFYALLKEGGGGDYVQVAARKEGDTTAAASLTPLAGAWIGANFQPSLGDPQITKQPESPSKIVESRTLKLVMDATVTPAVFGFAPIIQWQKDGKDIAGANAKTYKVAAATASDSGTYHAVVSAPSGKSVNTVDVPIAVVPDTFPPVPTVAALANQTSGYDVGIQFDEPVDQSAGQQSNYSISSGTITGFKYYTNSPGVALTVTGLNAGAKYTVTIKNVGDAKGNKITSTNVDFTVGKMAWGVVGADQLKVGNGVVAVGADGFDVYSDGFTEWANYDESTFVYEKITGDFDKKVRVEYQDLSSQWARAGLIMREVTNFGVDAVAQTGDPSGTTSNSGTPPFTGKAGRYQKIHVNPVGPTLTGPGTAGNGLWEGNRRLDVGGPSSSALTGANSTPLYPDAWCRLQRKGQTFTIYRSDDGANWVNLGSTTWPDKADPTSTNIPDTVYVGPEYSPENGNITDEASRGMFVAKFREYGDTLSTSQGPTISVARTGTGISITFTGTLQSADTVTGAWTDVPGSSPQNIATSGAAKFFRSKQ